MFLRRYDFKSFGYFLVNVNAKVIHFRRESLHLPMLVLSDPVAPGLSFLVFSYKNLACVASFSGSFPGQLADSRVKLE